MSQSLRLGQWLAKYRGDAGLTQADAAKAVGVHPMTVSEWERGNARVPAEALLKLLPLYGVTMADLPDNGKTEQLSENVARGTPGVVAEPRSAYPAASAFTSATSAQQSRLWIEQFLLELAEKGATEAFLADARRFLLSPENYEFDVARAPGQLSKLSDEERLEHMKGLASVVEKMWERRKKRGKSR